ncbi:MAG: sigma-54 dependent transcriptional regulator [Acidobacteriota bacterium]
MRDKENKILIVDDEEGIRNILSKVLREEGFSIETAIDGKEGMEKAVKFAPDIILLDLKLPDRNGIEILQEIKKIIPHTNVIILTAYGTIRSAVEATKLGAFDYLSKPVDNEELILIIKRALELSDLKEEVKSLRSELHKRYGFGNIIGMSPKMNDVFSLMEKLIKIDATVLIIGETGTGKELVARAIHFNSLRKNAPFIVVNCGAIPETLMESELFGYERGSFTDAKERRIGKFELAEGGTVLLDEIGELPLSSQVKILRAIGEKEITRVGSSKAIPVNVRVIAATNKNLEEEVKKGRFREDLFWRLSTVTLNLPPLRERKEDIPLLIEHFIKKFNKELNIDIKGLSSEAKKCLLDYLWPGNVRELENAVYEAMVLSSDDLIGIEDLPSRIVRDYGNFIDYGKSLSEAVENIRKKVEIEMIKRALKDSSGNKTRAAKSLGISRKTLFNKIKNYKI